MPPIRLLFASLFCLLSCIPDSALGNPSLHQSPDRQLVVALRASVATPEELVAAAASPNASERNRTLYEVLQRPGLARHLVDFRIPAGRDRIEVLLEEDRLDRYIVLTFSSEATRDTALMRLRANPGVEVAIQNQVMDWAATPGDPYFQITTDPRSYQIGMRTMLGLPAAWDNVRGSAYVAIGDIGIQVQPTLHPDLGFLWRPQFAKSFDSGPDSSVDERANPTIPYAGHGSHVAGIIAANTNNPLAGTGYPNSPPDGVAGVCWWCSAMVLRVADSAASNQPTVANLGAALAYTSRVGAQVINLSLGSSAIDANCNAGGNPVYLPVCDGLAFAAARGVTVVAAAGNNDFFNKIQFPANDSRTIAVGGVNNAGNRWFEANGVGSNVGPEMADHGVVAPAKDVVSTVYTGYDWNPGVFVRCGDSQQFTGETTPDSLGAGYGRCTGTSMATPFITGITALMRTVDPLMNAPTTRSRLFSSGSLAGSASWDRGHGIVDASVAVNAVLVATNRLTPLFSLYNSYWKDYFYTVVPQMGTSAVMDQMAVRDLAKDYRPYTSVGTSVLDYPSFPAAETKSSAKAQVWVFTTHVNPLGTNELKPLVRLSYRCGGSDIYRTVCNTNGRHIDHAYLTDLNEVTTFTSGGYVVDGFEGYLYPAGDAMPVNTVALMRARHVADDDYAVFPSTEQAAMAAAGYTDGLVTLGYAYLNSGPRPVY